MNIGTMTATLGVDSSGLVLANTAMTNFQKNTVTRLKTIGQGLRTYGYLASAALTMPIVLASKAMIKLAMDYETSLTKIVGLVGIAREQVNAWGEDIMKMAPEVGKGPKELADALYFITSAGIRGAEAMDVLRMSAMASAGGLGETKAIADLVTSAMNAYGIANLSAAQATDVLVATVREGKSEATALASTLGMVLPIASAMGVKFHEVGAAVASMTRTGTKATTASIQLRQILNSLIKPSHQAEEALRGMKTSSEELRKTIREKGLLAALMQIKQLSQVFGETVMSKVFPNIRALSGVLDILGSNLNDNIQIFNSLSNAAGSTARVFAEAALTMEFRFNRVLAKAKVQMTSLGKSLGEAFLPILEKWVDKLVKFTTKFDAMTESQKAWRLGLLKNIALLGPITMGFSVLSYTIAGTITLFTGLGKVLIFTTSMVKGLTQGLYALRPALAVAPGLTKWLVGLGKSATSAFSMIGVEGAALLTAAGVVLTATTVLIVKMAKEIKNAKEEQNGFNKVLVKMNDELVQMKSLTAVDYSKMNFMQLGDLKAATLSTRIKAYDNIKAAVERAGKTMEDFWNEGDMGKQQGYIDTQKKAWFEAGIQLTFINKALDDLADKFGLLTDKEIADLKAFNLAIDDLLKTFVKEETQIDATAEVMKKLGIGYNVTTQKAELYLTQIDRLIKEGLSPQDEKVQAIMKSYNALGVEILKEKTILEKYNDTLKEQNKELERVEKNRIKGGVPSDYKKLFFRTGQIGGGASIWNPEEEDRYSKFSLQLQNDIDTIARKEKILQEGFDDGRASVNMYSNAINYLIENFAKGNPIIDAAIEKYKGMFDELSKEIDTIKMIENVSNQLTNTFTDMFMSIGTGWGNMINTMSQAIKRLAAELAAKAVIFGILSLISGGTSNFAKGAGKLIKGGFGKFIFGAGMANGGVVPPGYPNDTYPAMLSSKEVVSPPGKLPNLRTSNTMKVVFVGKLLGKDMYLQQVRYVDELNSNT